VLGAIVLVLGTALWGMAPGEPAVAPQLFDLARAQGEVRVIVQLRVPDGAAPAEIATAQEALLAELAAVPHRIVRRYATIPFIALTASEAALRVLSASPHVVSVREDRDFSPLPAPR
jgi:hypothetical protein